MGDVTFDAKTLAGEHQLLLNAIASRLERDYGEHFTQDTLQHYVQDSYEELAQRATVRTHIPAFVERFAKQRLNALAKTTGRVVTPPADVLFVCQRNDALSQMAAALFHAQVGDRACAHSAGTVPAGALLDEAMLVLYEIGLEPLEAFPKPLTPEIEEAADVVVTLDAHDDVVVLDGKRYYAWRLPDRHADGLEGYRIARDELSGRIDTLLVEIFPK